MATTPTVEAMLHFKPVTFWLIKPRLAFGVEAVTRDPIAWHLGCCDVVRRKARDGRPSRPALVGRSAEPIARAEADPVSQSSARANDNKRWIIHSYIDEIIEVDFCLPHD